MYKIHYLVKPVDIHYEDSFCWARGTVEKETNSTYQLQSWVTCKDYVLDSYLRSDTAGFSKNNYTKEQLDNSCIYVGILRNSKEFHENMKAFNEWEKKHNLPETPYQIDKSNSKTTLNVVIFPDLKLWTQNYSAYSYYLSILRVFIVTGKLEGFYERSKYAVNEYSYTCTCITNDEYLRFKDEKKGPLLNFIKYIINNPEVVLTESDNFPYPCGNTTDMYEGHGSTGLFYFLSRVYYYYRYHICSYNKEYANYYTLDAVKTNFWYGIYEKYLLSINSVFSLAACEEYEKEAECKRKEAAEAARLAKQEAIRKQQEEIAAQLKAAEDAAKEEAKKKVATTKRKVTPKETNEMQGLQQTTQRTRVKTKTVLW